VVCLVMCIIAVPEHVFEAALEAFH
jgi:hypothetical protein